VTLREAVTVSVTPWQETAFLFWQFTTGSATIHSSMLVSLANRGIAQRPGSNSCDGTKPRLRASLFLCPAYSGAGGWNSLFTPLGPLLTCHPCPDRPTKTQPVNERNEVMTLDWRALYVPLLPLFSAETASGLT